VLDEPVERALSEPTLVNNETDEAINPGPGPAPFRNASGVPLQQNPQARNTQINTGRLANGKLGASQHSSRLEVSPADHLCRQWIKLGLQYADGCSGLVEHAISERGHKQCNGLFFADNERINTCYTP